MKFEITFESGRWLVDGKRWEELNLDERNHLDNFFNYYLIADAMLKERSK